MIWDMSEKNVIILRGVSGSGKSSFAKLISNAVVCTADDYFMDENGNYNFDPTKIGKAHEECQKKFLDAFKNPDVINVVVANTNTKPSDYKFYEDVAKTAGIKVFYVVVEKRHNKNNIHSVPDFVLSRQHTNLVADLNLI